MESLTLESLARALWDTYRQSTVGDLPTVYVRGKGHVPMPARIEDGPQHEQDAFRRQAKLLMARIMQ